MSIHVFLIGGIVVGLVSPNIFRQTPVFSRQLGFWLRCRSRWVAVVCRGFTSVVLSDFSMAIVLIWTALVSIHGRFTSARMASTGVVRSLPVMARPA